MNEKTMHLYPINGAAQRVGRTETPWSHRDATWAEVIVGVDPDPANAKRITEWTKAYWDALHPYSAGGAYVNFMMDEGEERIEATYRDNYARLASLKKKYDPIRVSGGSPREAISARSRRAHASCPRSWCCRERSSAHRASWLALQERRRALHGRIVEAIERLSPDRLAGQRDRLIPHAFRGEVWGKAARAAAGSP